MKLIFLAKQGSGMPAETNLFVLNGGYDQTGSYLGSNDGHVTGTYQSGFDVRNHTAIMPCRPNTTYVISMYMQDRCRIGSHPSVPPDKTTLNKYLQPTYGSTTGYNTNITVEFTTGVSDTFLFIYYWSSDVSTGDYTICYNTINVTKKS